MNTHISSQPDEEIGSNLAGREGKTASPESKPYKDDMAGSMSSDSRPEGGGGGEGVTGVHDASETGEASTKRSDVEVPFDHHSTRESTSTNRPMSTTAPPPWQGYRAEFKALGRAPVLRPIGEQIAALLEEISREPEDSTERTSARKVLPLVEQLKTIRRAENMDVREWKKLVDNFHRLDMNPYELAIRWLQDYIRQWEVYLMERLKMRGEKSVQARIREEQRPH